MNKLVCNYKREFAKGLVLLCILLTLRFAGNSQFAFALCFGLYVASSFCGVGVLTASVAYLVSSAFFGIEVFLWSVTSFATTAVLFVLRKALKKQASTRWFISTLFLGQIFFLAYHTASIEDLLSKILCAFVSILFAYISLFCIKSVFIRGLRYRLGGDEKICIYVFAVCVAMGLSQINPWGFSLLRVVAGFAMLTMLFVFDGFSCMMTAVLFGMGSAFGSGALTDGAIFAIWGVVAVSLRQIKSLCMLSVPIIDLVIKYFFRGQIVSVLDTIALLVGCVAFAVIPKSVLQRWNDKMGRNAETYAIRSIVNRTKNNLSRKLYDLSEIFFEMKLSFSSMVKGVMPREQAKVVLAREVSETVCQDCAERTTCWRTYMEKTERAFLTIMEGAMDRGKATVFDLPNGMTQSCKRLNSVLSHVNQAVDRYKHYYLVTTNNDNSRMLISEQLAGVSDIMKNLSIQSKVQSHFDREKEGMLFEQLTRVGVLTKEVVVTNERENLFVTIVVSAQDSKKTCIGKVVSKVCGVRMMLTETQNTQNKNWIVMTFVIAPKFDVTFGFCATKKQDSKVSGDTHTFLRIDEHRFLLGLCDGMGSGEEAEKASSRAISLIENFYKAGFDNETILTSVNRLLTLSQDETFTAVDISVVDLQEGICDFIKIGATCGFVKSRDKVEIISAGSLPLGVLEEMTPCITKKALRDGDVVVMVSDGVTDAFATKEELALAIADIALKTPQEIAEIILQQALEKQGGVAKDDMTVIVSQIFECEDAQ